MTTQPITVADLAAELGFTVPEIALMVTKFCRELGPQQVVHTAASSRANTVLHAAGAEAIRSELATI